MTKREINPLDYATHVLTAVKSGVLITAASGDKINPMTISWGTLGIEWGEPIFITFVREGRFTRELLDETMCFTVNVPLGDAHKDITRFCGMHSGRSFDKIKETGLHPVPADCVAAPALREFPLTLECEVVHRQLQDKTALRPDHQHHYPQDVPSTAPLGNKDYHIAYYGKIVKAYILED